MDKEVEDVLAEYDARVLREKAIWADPTEANRRRDELLLYVGPATAQFMNILVRGSKPKVMVEVGTSYGYSAVWLGDAAKAVGATLHSLELAQDKVDYARERIARAGLADHVVFHVGDALASIAALPGPFDFVLLDLWKDLYIPCFDLIYPKLAKGAYIIADNMLEPEGARANAEAYRKHIQAKPGISSVLLPIGSGIELSRFD
jgi:predicted O-methyltransferase YrrM